MPGQILEYDMIEKESLETKPYSPFREFLKDFRKNKPAVGGALVIVFLFVVAFTVWFLGQLNIYFPYDPNETDMAIKLSPPSLQHPLGTDQLGRDVLARMLHGARISLLVGFVAVGIAVTVGILVGSIAGYFGGWIDNLLMRLVDAVISFPSFFLILTVVALLKPSFWNVMIVIGLTGWTGTARFIRAEFLSLKEREFVQAAHALGGKSSRIILVHLLPNALMPVLVSATLGVAGAILTEAGLSFLGFGVQPPQPTWGNILTEGRLYIFDAWWLTLFPGLAILITVLSFNLVGEGLRDALDPRSR
ncbi:MAG TPA: ABC transporter permease [Candidatus Limnocylindrales bacterium]|nr:ABC transporter permease [Candidatus Limnocylindrales bacterium]